MRIKSLIGVLAALALEDPAVWSSAAAPTRVRVARAGGADQRQGALRRDRSGRCVHAANAGERGPGRRVQDGAGVLPRDRAAHADAGLRHPRRRVAAALRLEPQAAGVGNGGWRIIRNAALAERSKAGTPLPGPTRGTSAATGIS